MEIVVDTREQLPYTEYFNKLGLKYQMQALSVGDYSVVGIENFAIERKSLSDFIHSITFERDRFERELVKAKNYDFFAVIIEASLYDIQNRNYRSKVHPNTILSTMLHWTVKYKIPFLLVESRTGGALAVIEMSKAYLKYKEEANE